MIKVSIVMPSLNVVNYIGNCIESVVQQSMTDIELICVDAGSTDGTFEIIQEYAKHYSNIKVIKSDIKSYGYQVNLGMNHAEGEYIGIVETDDIINHRMYEKLYDVAQKYSVDVVKADFCKFVINDGEMIKTEEKIAKPFMYNRVLSHDECLVDIITSASLYTWAGIYRKAFLFDNNIKHNESLGASYQDNGFWFLTMSRAKTVYFLNESLYMLRRDNPNSSIFNKDKAFVIFDEYDYVLSQISLWEDKKEILPLFWWARFGATRYHYRRVANKYKKDFIRKFHDVYLEAYELCLIDEKLYSRSSYADLVEIVNAPFKYHRNNMKQGKKQNVWMKLKSIFASVSARKKAETIDNSDDIKKMNHFADCVARIDMKNEGDKDNAIEIVSISDESCKITRPSWFTNEHGEGLVVESALKRLDILIRCKGNGSLVIRLKGVCMYSKNHVVIPNLVDFTKFQIDEKVIFMDSNVVYHNKPYVYKKKVTNDEIIRIRAEWKNVDNTSVFFPEKIFDSICKKTDKIDLSNVYDIKQNENIARVDIKNIGTFLNDIEIVSNKGVIVCDPKELMQKDGCGKIVFAQNRNVAFDVKANSAGLLDIFLRGPHLCEKRNNDGKICFMKFCINGKNRLEKEVCVNYLNAYHITKEVGVGEVVSIEVEWRVCQ